VFGRVPVEERPSSCPWADIYAAVEMSKDNEKKNPD
jgi:hypothetical protein